MKSKYSSSWFMMKRLMHQHKLSQIFKPLNVAPKDAIIKREETTSISKKLMSEYGIIHGQSIGMHALLPLGQRALMKLIKLIDEEMLSVGAQRISLPFLTVSQLWKKTGRWDAMGPELMRVRDRHNQDFVISPTHEEAITDLVGNVHMLSHRTLPLRLYQISSKMRDEIAPKFGLLRTKEFVMKDLYTFDPSEDAAVCTYNTICDAYDRVFKRIGVPYIKVTGDCGDIGGSYSHEYHYPAAIGEDTLLQCQKCGDATNSELVSDTENTTCSTCGNQMTKKKGIEVGHTFLLGTKYSKPLKSTYIRTDTKPEYLQMGCYGLGVSRILAAVIEVQSSSQHIVWPWTLAPFKVCLISPKKGSKEARATTWIDHLYSTINNIPDLKDDVIVDDRDTFTIGKRLVEARNTGYPIIIVVGKRCLEDVPLFELMNGRDDSQHFLSQRQLLEYLRKESNLRQSI